MVTLILKHNVYICTAIIDHKFKTIISKSIFSHLSKIFKSIKQKVIDT